MRVVINGDVFGWQRRGGIARMYERIIPLLIRQGIDVRVMVLGVHRNQLPISIGAVACCIPQFRCRLRPWRLWWPIFRWVNRLIEQGAWLNARGDIIVPTHYSLPVRHPPLVAVVYDMVFEVFAKDYTAAAVGRIRADKRRCVEQAKAVICISRSTSADVQRFYGVPGDRITVIHLASGLTEGGEASLPMEVRSDIPFLLYVGDHLTPYKNFDFVRETLASGACQAVAAMDLVVVSPYMPDGAGPVALSGGVPGRRLVFVPQCNDATLAALYRRCAAFIYPSLYEGFGIPVLEALSLGTPVVCSNTSSLPEVGGAVAYYFEPRSVDGFTRALSAAVGAGRTPDLVALRKAHAETFSWERVAAEFAAVLRTAMHQSRPGRRDEAL